MFTKTASWLKQLFATFTKAGVGFMAAGVVVYIMGSQTQVGWLYMIDAVIWSMLLLSAFLPWWSLRALRVERQVWLPRDTDRLHGYAMPMEDDTVDVRITVSNHGRLARHLVKLVDSPPFEEPSKGTRTFLVSTINPNSATAFTYTATCYRRGRYLSAETVLESSAPLGLFVRRRRYLLPVNVTVYPVQLVTEADPAATEVWADQGRTVKSGGGSELYGSREYHHGDPLRRVHWRNTARRGQFIVKEFEESSQGAVLVAFEDRREWGDGRDTTFEYAVRVAASLARQRSASGHGIGILAGPEPRSEAYWLDAMDYLATLAVGGATGLDEPTESVAAGQTLVAVVPAAAPSPVPPLSRLSARGVRVVAVLLEGFAEDESPSEVVSVLGHEGISVVRCTRGNLAEAVEALGRTLELADIPVGAAG